MSYQEEAVELQEGEVFTFPASFAQQRLWFFDQLEPGKAVYNIASAFRLTGSLNVSALEQSLHQIVQRHESLRTTFAAVDGEPVQVIEPYLATKLPVVDLSALPAAEQKTEVKRVVDREARWSFDLSTGPLFRATLLKLSPAEYVLALVTHHIIFDGWSLETFANELAELYAAFAAGKSAHLPEPPLQYADFVIWQREWLQGEVLQPQLDYWQNQLYGKPPVLELPTDFPRPSVQSNHGSWARFELSPAVTEGLKTLSRSEGVSLFMTMLAGFNVLLARYTGQTDIFVGTPTANRNQPELEKLIGFFINPIVLRTNLAGNPTFRELLKQVREVTLGAYANQDIPFERLVEALHPERDLSYHPLFQVLFTLQNSPLRLDLTGVEAEPLEFDNGTAKFDMLIELWEENGGVTGRFEYNSELFQRSTIERLMAHYQTLLATALAGPDTAIGRLPMLTETEQSQLVVDWNKTATTFPAEKDLLTMVEAQAARHPAAVAVEFGRNRLTYAELNRRANQLAHYLHRAGVGPDTQVGISLERSLELVVGVLGVLKAGAAYVPLDPTYPKERLTYMLADAQAPVLLTQSYLKGQFPDYQGHIVCLDTGWATIAQESPERPPYRATPENLAYVIYTSGSTGRPKGVALPYRALSNLIAWQLEQPRLASPARTLQFTSLSFDVSFQEIFSTWCSGGTLVLVSESVRRDVDSLSRFIATQQIERLFVPFVALQQLAELLSGQPQLTLTLKDVITAGEQLQITRPIIRLFNRLADPALHNHYGPSETHVVTAFTLTGPPSSWPALPPIGQPIANSQIYLLDAHLQPVPVGVPGELYIGGVGVARGYRDRPELTAQRFVPDPFSRQPGARLYKPGDLARYLPDGNIEFLGRVDHQVKIRGFRVELGEIETVLGQHPAVKETAVVAREDVPGDKRLVAYVVPLQTAPPAHELRQFLQDRLPDYMIPSAFVMLEALPLTPSGKVNRRALPKPDSARQELESSYLAARSEVEAQLVAIWEEVLNIRPVGIRDNFFELGGHSLMAIRLFAQIEKALGQKLPLPTLFKSPTIEQLAKVLGPAAEPVDWSSLVPIQPNGSRPPFFCVHGFGGGVVGYADLAQLLGQDQPFYGLQAQGQNGVEEPHADIESMAAYCLQAMRAFQPSGPYYLGGYCLGGVVAYEMAQQLYAMGEPVALLAIFEGYAPTKYSLWNPAHALNFLRNLPYWFNDYLQLGYSQLAIRLRRKAKESWKRLAQRFSPNVELTLDDLLDDAPLLPADRRKLMETQIRALNKYQPNSYPGQATLFRVKGLSLFNSHDPEMGWGKLVQNGVEIKMIAGMHANILQKPHVEVLARQLKASLEQAQASAAPKPAGLSLAGQLRPDQKMA